MKLTDKPSSKNLIIVMAVVICAVLAVGVSFAAYTSQGYMRGVARNSDSENIRFSSNYLKNCTKASADKGEYVGRVLMYSDGSTEENNLTIDIYVYNYVQGNKNLVNENDITYNMSIKLTGATKSDYSVKLLEGDQATAQDLTKSASDATGITYTTSSGVVLKGRKAHEHHYTVTITGADLNKLRITAVATPENMSVTGNQLLAAILTPCTESTVQSFTCTGTFADAASGGSPKDYDAFNYEVTISTGRANVTIEWDPSLVEIDEFFIKKLNSREEDAGCTYDKTAGTLTFVMDQSKGTDDYMIPFYLVSPQEALPDNWDDMKKYVKNVSGIQIDTSDN